MKNLPTFEAFINENALFESLGILPKEDYPIYIAVRTDKVGDNYMASAVLPDRDQSAKYNPMSYVLEELRNHFKMSKGEFPSNKVAFDKYRMKNMDVKGTTMKLNWGPQNRGYQIINIYSPDKKELENIAELIQQFAIK
jgi:hypothetical protein